MNITPSSPAETKYRIPYSISGTFFALSVFLLLSSGCSTFDSREVVLLDSRGVLPPPYVKPVETAEPVNERTEEQSPTDIEPFPTILEDELSETEYKPLFTEDEQMDTEPMETDTLTYTVKPGDNLWNISRKYGITHQELAAYNNLNLDDILRVGQKLEIPPGGSLQDHVESAPRTTNESDNDSREPPRTNLKPGEKYTVRRGDTLSEIAADIGVRVKDIKELNNLDSDVIHIGETLVMPKDADISDRSQEDTSEEEDEPFPWENNDASNIDDDSNNSDIEEEGGQETAEDVPTLNHTVLDSEETLEDIAAMYGVELESLRRQNPGITNSDIKPDMTIKVPIE